MDQLNSDFETLLAQYRHAAGEPEPSVNFMPRLWQRIEAKRSFAFRFRRVTQVFVGASAVLCLLIAGVMTVMPNEPITQLSATYVDALAEAYPADTLAAQGIVLADSNEVQR